jgi:hypothetical protein
MLLTPGTLLFAPCPPPRRLFRFRQRRYRYELGNYYARKMSDLWQEGSWRLEKEHWVLTLKKNTLFFGLKALQNYADAVNLSPADAWYHFYFGWTLSELKRFSVFTGHQVLPRSL